MQRKNNLIQAAIIGFGRMGERHLKALQKLGIFVSGIVDHRPAAIRRAHSLYKIPKERLFNKVSLFFKNKIADLIIVATTADSHKKIVEKAALGNTKYILCEKPMATSLKECLQMIKICKKNKVKLSINHQMRFLEQYKIPKKYIQQKKLGKFCSMNLVAGNIGLAMNISHYFEAFRFLANEPICSVAAKLDQGYLRNPRGKAFLDKSGVIFARTKSGKRFFAECSKDQGYGLFVAYNFQYGQFRIDEITGRGTLVIRKKQFRKLGTSFYACPATFKNIKIKGVETVNSTADSIQALIKGENYVTALQGLNVVKALLACYASNRKNGRTVFLSSIRKQSYKMPWA